jgi:hypothetical protein
MQALRYITIFQPILNILHVILKASKALKIICISIPFIPWMNFLCIKLTGILMLQLFTSECNNSTISWADFNSCKVFWNLEFHISQFAQ